MRVVDLQGNPAQILYPTQYEDQLEAWEKRRQVTLKLSDLLRVSNTKRNEFLFELEQLMNKYANTPSC